jgi:hypothetical protein
VSGPGRSDRERQEEARARQEALRSAATIGAAATTAGTATVDASLTTTNELLADVVAALDVANEHLGNIEANTAGP